MKDQIIMSKANGELAVAIPLYRYFTLESDVTSCSTFLTVPWNIPIAYLIDIGDAQHVMSAKFVEENSIFLGYL